MSRPNLSGTRIAAYGSIIFFVIMAFEVMIMISPFAFFFYSVFSPVFNFLGRHEATRWATMFFLPHMILPPTTFLQVIRVAGSVFFVIGFAVFVVCALQVYLGKIFKWGIAARGLYRYIRHPQYLALGVWGIGMAILWPRFIVLASLALMFVLYYFLAKDEERRMLNQYGESYRQYMNQTGMFFPRIRKAADTSLANLLFPARPVNYVMAPLLIVTLVMGAGVVLREITLSSLPVTIKDNLTLVPILPEDRGVDGAVVSGIIQGAAAGQIPFLTADKVYLGYVMPPDYIMQGMIADTGGHFHLFKKHHTVAMIADWVFHPFEHLRRPPAAQMAAMHGVDPQVARRHHCPVGLDQAGMDCDTCTIKRVILLEVEPGTDRQLSGAQLLGGGVRRTPVGVVDVDSQTGKILKVTPVGKGSAWKDVPTPEI